MVLTAGLVAAGKLTATGLFLGVGFWFGHKITDRFDEWLMKNDVRLMNERDLKVA